MFQAILHNLGGLLLPGLSINWNIHQFTYLAQLVKGRGPVHIGRDKADLLALLLEMPGQLTTGGCLSITIQTDHHDDLLLGPQLFFITQGYALLDSAQMPVVGDPETMNDTFVQQIVSSAKAAIDKLDSMGVIDPKRVGVGGHSYGAFMTANLLAHCDLFAAGIARSGAYNRTLTPF